MFRFIGAALLAAGITIGAALPAQAGNSAVTGAIIGGAAGAIVGGAVTGNGTGALVGGAIGAGTGAAIGASQNQKKSPYYWQGGHCYYRQPNGYVVRAQSGYCR